MGLALQSKSGMKSRMLLQWCLKEARLESDRSLELDLPVHLPSCRLGRLKDLLRWSR